MGKFVAAAIQMEPVIGDVDGNIETILQKGRQAARSGASLIVYPELATSGYCFKSLDEARDCAIEVEGSAHVLQLIELCRDEDLLLVVGYAEKSGSELFNSAMLLGPDGVIGNYRKNHLWNLENKYFLPGDTGHPVFETSLGTVGIMICYDCWFPETARSLVLQGADIICVPTNWVPIPGQPESERAMATILCQATAHLNGIYIIGADRVGTERGQRFLGQSIVTDYTGWHIAGPASSTETGVLYGDIDLKAARDSRRWNEYNHPVENRRADTYLTDRK